MDFDKLNFCLSQTLTKQLHQVHLSQLTQVTSVSSRKHFQAELKEQRAFSMDFLGDLPTFWSL